MLLQILARFFSYFSTFPRKVERAEEGEARKGSEGVRFVVMPPIDGEGDVGAYLDIAKRDKDCMKDENWMDENDSIIRYKPFNCPFVKIYFPNVLNVLIQSYKCPPHPLESGSSAKIEHFHDRFNKTQQFLLVVAWFQFFISDPSVLDNMSLLKISLNFYKFAFEIPEHYAARIKTC